MVRDGALKSIDVNRSMEVHPLLFADEAALVTDSSVKINSLVSYYGIERMRRKLKINVEKIEVMTCST